ncbi:MAG: branched-chain amino acid transport system ATP-binding protein [Solirubrobacteraceae bacterium]|jgi:branched-chain amino acid transport system ATP-binding protein|nr:branched-chain amino acid transport system ATP-binding protein [Solirubrobacteraceae bacterium]MEA2278368.1 branched-chain amino acid transport system ATP-binding protein [Solirubrobacteraceae bacterium]MEA2393886.1 branched-chain amino acid transport system ATP-binding protein [Solirubrobacteraceae bacterium]
MLSVENLTVRYGPVVAVQQLSLECKAGELVALLGPNGGGKSSTLLAIAGALPAESVGGDVSFEGTSLRGRSPESIVRDGIALVPEGRRIFGRLTVEDNLLLGATVRRDQRAVRADIDELVGRFPVLGRKLQSAAGTLSGGEQQQLAIARALLARPRLLMLDEPSLGLAPLVIDEMFDIIVRLRSEGTTILLVEQNALRAMEISDRCYLVHHGRLEMEGPSSTLLANPDFINAYFGSGVGAVAG